MTDQNLQNELNRIEKLAPKLDPYWQREIQELPKELITEIKQISVIPSYTSGGIESVGSVLKDLYIAKALLQDEIEAQTSSFVSPKIETKNPPPTKPQPKIPVKTTPPVKPSNIQIKSDLPTKIDNTPKEIQIKKSPLPSVAMKPTMLPTTKKQANNIDFGHYYDKNNQPNP